MIPTSFIIRTKLGDEVHDFPYATVNEALQDRGLRAAFDCDHVTKCSVHTRTLRVTAGPITTWEALAQQLERNRSTLERGC